MYYVYAWEYVLDAIEHCRANLDSIRTLVERQILSVPVNDKSPIRIVNAKRIRYASETTSPHVAMVSFNHDVLLECQIPRRILRLRRLYSVIWGFRNRMNYMFWWRKYTLNSFESVWSDFVWLRSEMVHFSHNDW
jgi:hypothetical protein